MSLFMGSPGEFNKIRGGFNPYGNLQVLRQIIHQRSKPVYQLFDTDKRQYSEHQWATFPASLVNLSGCGYRKDEYQ